MGTDCFVNVVSKVDGTWTYIQPPEGMRDWPVGNRNYRMFALLTGGEVWGGRSTEGLATMPKPRGWQGLLDVGVFPKGFDIHDDIASEGDLWSVALRAQHWLALSDFDLFEAAGGYDAPKSMTREIREMHQLLRRMPAATLVVFSFDQ